MFMQTWRTVTGELRTQRACRRRSTPTFLFADLVGYTALTEAVGDAAAADLAREFRRTMCALSRDHGARQVKSMGGGDWYGSAVNVAARLADQAKPNEALVSEATWATARCEFTRPVDTPRELVLRGLDRRVAAWRLA
jgi:class 3 adenylate cyclase